MVPGVDLAGILLEDAGDIAAGTEIIVHGYDLGVNRHGGFAQFATPRMIGSFPCPLASPLVKQWCSALLGTPQRCR